MRPTDAAIKAAYRDETVPLHVWAAGVGLPRSTLRDRIAHLGLTGRVPVHGGGRPPRFTDDQLRAAFHDRTRTVAELAAAMGTSQPRLSVMFRRLGLGKRVAVRRNGLPMENRDNGH